MTKAVGLELLYEPPIEVSVIADIVFVHGLNGDRHDTWTRKLKDGGRFPASLRSSSRVSRAFASFSKRISRRGDPGGSRSQSPAPVSGQPSSGQDERDESPGPLEVFWPQDLLPKQLPACRIFTWGYNVDLQYYRASTSTASVFSHARTLLSDLADARMSKGIEKRPLIFVAHSLGGIVVKDVCDPFAIFTLLLEVSIVRLCNSHNGVLTSVRGGSF